MFDDLSFDHVTDLIPMLPDYPTFQPQAPLPAPVAWECDEFDAEFDASLDEAELMVNLSGMVGGRFDHFPLD